jgi:hypothetical protein
MTFGNQEIVMKVKKRAADHISLVVSQSELGRMGNALNEVCNGIHVVDFKSKMGGNPDEVQRVLDDIVAIYRKMEKSGSSLVTVNLCDHELRAIIGALKEVCVRIDEFEFATRMGAERSEVEEILGQKTPIYLKMKQFG